MLNRRQTIIWINDGLVYWCLTTSINLEELNNFVNLNLSSRESTRPGKMNQMCRSKLIWMHSLSFGFLLMFIDFLPKYSISDQHNFLDLWTNTTLNEIKLIVAKWGWAASYCILTWFMLIWGEYLNIAWWLPVQANLIVTRSIFFQTSHNRHT